MARLEFYFGCDAGESKLLGLFWFCCKGSEVGGAGGGGQAAQAASLGWLAGWRGDAVWGRDERRGKKKLINNETENGGVCPQISRLEETKMQGLEWGGQGELLKRREGRRD